MLTDYNQKGVPPVATPTKGPAFLRRDVAPMSALQKTCGAVEYAFDDDGLQSRCGRARNGPQHFRMAVVAAEFGHPILQLIIGLSSVDILVFHAEHFPR